MKEIKGIKRAWVWAEVDKLLIAKGNPSSCSGKTPGQDEVGNQIPSPGGNGFWEYAGELNGVCGPAASCWCSHRAFRILKNCLSRNYILKLSGFPLVLLFLDFFFKIKFKLDQKPPGLWRWSRVVCAQQSWGLWSCHAQTSGESWQKHFEKAQRHLRTETPRMLNKQSQERSCAWMWLCHCCTFLLLFVMTSWPLSKYTEVAWMHHLDYLMLVWVFGVFSTAYW